MSFIRAKEIPPRSGNWYDYEVRSVRRGNKVIQEHIRYIGKSGKTTGRMNVLPVIVKGDGIVTGAESKVTCVHCGNDHTRKYGTYNGEQRYWCNDCKRKFSNDGSIPNMKTPAKQIASAMGMYYGGMPLDAIQQQFRQDYDLDMSESNFWNWVDRFTKEAVKQSANFKPVVGNTWIADETYMKLGKSKVYFWDIIDADTRYLLATHVSFSRSGRDAKALMKKAESRAGKTPKVVVTDRLKSYLVGIEEAFGADTTHKAGGPFKVEANTNLIERFHKTLEQRTRVFQKYQDLKHIRLLTGGWLINYNFFKQHESIGNIPPAQAMSKTVPFKDWRDVVRDTNVIPETEYQVTKHSNPTAVTLTPLHEKIYGGKD